MSFKSLWRVLLPLLGIWLLSTTAANAMFLSADPVGAKDDPNLYMYVGLDPVNFSDPTGMRRDGFRLTDPRSFYGQGHSAYAVTNRQGRVVAGEYGMYDPQDANGDGSNAVNRQISGMPTSVRMSDGDVSTAGAVAIVSAFADAYDIDTVDVSHFPEADNLSGAQNAIAAIDAGIARGQDYNVLSCNCGTVAAQVLENAGAEGVSDHFRPNTASKEERRGPDAPAQGDFSGRWQRKEDGEWWLSRNR